MRFKKDEDTLFQGNEGGQAGSILPAASAYFVFGCNDRLKMGLSVNSPYGGNYNYGKSWTGRYFTQRVFLATLAANPSIAYRITPKLSFGAGFTVEYGYLQQALALNPAVFGQLPVINPDGRLKLLMDSFAYGYNFGLMYQLTPCTRLGVTYRSRLKHDFEGRAEVTGPNKAISLGIDTNLTFADYPNFTSCSYVKY